MWSSFGLRRVREPATTPHPSGVRGASLDTAGGPVVRNTEAADQVTEAAPVELKCPYCTMTLRPTTTIEMGWVEARIDEEPSTYVRNSDDLTCPACNTEWRRHEDGALVRFGETRAKGLPPTRRSR